MTAKSFIPSQTGTSMLAIEAETVFNLIKLLSATAATADDLSEAEKDFWIERFKVLQSLGDFDAEFMKFAMDNADHAGQEWETGAGEMPEMQNFDFNN